MSRADVIRAISIHCRRRHEAALYAMAYLVQEESTETLERLLEALLELQAVGPDWKSHLAAYAERWGRLPDPR